jgi:hypothetical protein
MLAIASPAVNARPMNLIFMGSLLDGDLL